MKEEIQKIKKSDSTDIITGIVKGAFGAVPFAGTAINEAIFDTRARIKQKRFEEFVNCLADKLKEVEEAVFKQEFIKNEDFCDLLEAAINKATATKHAEKIRLFSNIIGSHIIDGSEIDYDKELILIELISSLTINELIVLKYLTPHKPKVHSLFTIEESEEEKNAREEYNRLHKFEFDSINVDYSKDVLFELPPNEVRLAIETLISKSIAYDDSAARIDTKPRTFIGLTPLGKELLEYLLEKNNR